MYYRNVTTDPVRAASPDWSWHPS